MEIEKLIKHMREEAQDYRSGRTLGRAFADAEDVLDEAATALEQLQAESDRLKEEVQQMRWIPVEERLPVVQDKYIVTACDEGCPYGEGIWYSTVVVVPGDPGGHRGHQGGQGDRHGFCLLPGVPL